jgi:hypothetical protein
MQAKKTTFLSCLFLIQKTNELFLFTVSWSLLKKRIHIFQGRHVNNNFR